MTATMAPPRRQRVQPAPQPVDEKKPGRTGSTLSAVIDEDIRAAMDQFIAKHNKEDEHPASIRSTLEAALKMYLREKGFWPPKS